MSGNLWLSGLSGSVQVRLNQTKSDCTSSYVLDEHKGGFSVLTDHLSPVPQFSWLEHRVGVQGVVDLC